MAGELYLTTEEQGSKCHDQCDSECTCKIVSTFAQLRRSPNLLLCALTFHFRALFFGFSQFISGFQLTLALCLPFSNIPFSRFHRGCQELTFQGIHFLSMSGSPFACLRK